MHHVAGREVPTRVLVQRLVELADQLLEDRPHRRVVDLLGMQVDVLEALGRIAVSADVLERLRSAPDSELG